MFKRFVSWIRFVLRCSKDSFRGFVSYYGVQKICFVDSIRTTVFKRFVSWIRFVRPKISKDSIRFVSEGFVYESRILSCSHSRKSLSYSSVSTTKCQVTCYLSNGIAYVIVVLKPDDLRCEVDLNFR